MKKPDATFELQQLILLKETEHKIEGLELKAHVRETFESLRPVNIIKSSLKELATSPEVKSSVVNAAIDLVAGFVAKKLSATGNNPLIRLAGIAIETVVAAKVAGNTDGVKSLGASIVSGIIQRFTHPDKK